MNANDGEENIVVKIPAMANRRLDELRGIADPPLNKGQMAALAIKEKWERDIANAGQTRDVDKEMSDFLLEKYGGDAGLAIANIPSELSEGYKKVIAKMIKQKADGG